jgi:hypothetical protein
LTRGKQLLVGILILIVVGAVGLVRAALPAFGCYGICAGCNPYCDAHELTECCGFCEWPGGGPPGEPYILCCFPNEGCYLQ